MHQILIIKNHFGGYVIFIHSVFTVFIFPTVYGKNAFGSVCIKKLNSWGCNTLWGFTAQLWGLGSEQLKTAPNQKDMEIIVFVAAVDVHNFNCYLNLFTWKAHVITTLKVFDAVLTQCLNKLKPQTVRYELSTSDFLHNHSKSWTVCSFNKGCLTHLFVQ